MELAFGQQPEGLPAGAFDGVLGLAVEGLEVIRMVPQLQFQARAALVFGELHDSMLMDRVRGISYEFTMMIHGTTSWRGSPYFYQLLRASGKFCRVPSPYTCILPPEGGPTALTHGPPRPPF